MNYFVTTSIPYVNGDPHLGHALEFIMADVLARYSRASKTPTIYSTGTDEHGGKIAEKAKELGIDTQAFTDQTSQKFRELQQALDISNDRFIRTTDAGHVQRAQIIWKNLEKFIYKGSYEGWYCTGCETFVPENIVQERGGSCPEHNRPYEKLKEDNYFFKLSAVSDQIKKAIESDTLRIIPHTRKQEILNIIGGKLEDISISRPKDKISWGIPVPGDDSQVMYVWFEALMNYITVLGYPEHDDFKKYWPANVQVIGKDILRFHAAVWPGMLLALGIPLPQILYVHGHITVGGKKMSKSLGNGVDPYDVLKKYGADVFRYYILRHIPSYDDGDFSWEGIESAYNTELANELGNAVQRTAVMIQKYQNGLIGDVPEPQHDTAEYEQALEDCKFDRALDEIWEQVRGLNQYIEEQKPWEIAKHDDAAHLKDVLAYQVSCLLQIADLLEPFMPNTTVKIRHIFEEGVIRQSSETLFPREAAHTE